jgi:AcrR family transcriptional regulator
MVRRMPTAATAAFAPMQRALHRSLGVVNETAELAERTTSTGKYSPAGVKEIMSEHIRNKVAPGLAEDRRAIEAAKAQLAARRAEIGTPKIDRSDVFAELQRQEIRAAIRALPASDRFPLVISGDKTVLEAVLSASPLLSGITPDRIAEARKMAVEANYPAEMAEIETIDEAIAVATSILEMAEMAVADTVGGDRAVFNP